MNLPTNLHYTAEHLWVKATDNGHWLAGITDYAQDLLGDIVFIEFPEVGKTLSKDTPCGLVESVKTGSDLHAPLNGAVTEINESLMDNPEAINNHPYQSWIFKFKPATESDINALLTAEAYQALTD